jgi:uncharacterized protein YjbI with pentapeptide repeats
VEPLTLEPADVVDGESWEDVVVVETTLAGIDARALGFSDSEFDATDLSGAKLQNLFLAGCRLRRANVANTVVRNGSMRQVGVDGSRLTGVTWNGGHVRESSLRDCRAVRFERCDLSAADFSGARLERCEMRGCMLDGRRGVDRLRGVAMPIGDILAAAPLFATAIGVRVLEE